MVVQLLFDEVRQAAEGSERTLGLRHRALVDESDGHAKSLLDLLLNEHDEIDQAERVEPRIVSDKRDLRRLAQSLFGVEDLVEVVDGAVDGVDHRLVGAHWLCARRSRSVSPAACSRLRNLFANSSLKIASNVTSSNRPFLRTCSRRRPSFFQPITR